MLKVCTKFTSYMIPFVQSSKGQKCSLMIEVSMMITFKDRKEHEKCWDIGSVLYLNLEGSYKRTSAMQTCLTKLYL